MSEKREKKVFTVSLDKKLVQELERRAKRDYLSVQELINKILWKSSKSSLNRKRNPSPKKADKFIEIFSRYQPISSSSEKFYYCKKCQKNHLYSSNIGKEHIEHKRKSRKIRKRKN